MVDAGSALGCGSCLFVLVRACCLGRFPYTHGGLLVSGLTAVVESVLGLAGALAGGHVRFCVCFLDSFPGGGSGASNACGLFPVFNVTEAPPQEENA